MLIQHLSESEIEQKFGGLEFKTNFKYYEEENNATLTLSLCDSARERMCASAIFDNNNGIVTITTNLNSYSQLDDKGNTHATHNFDHSLCCASAIVEFLAYIKGAAKASFSDLAEFYTLESEQRAIKKQFNEQVREQRLETLMTDHPLLTEQERIATLDLLKGGDEVEVIVIFSSILRAVTLKLSKLIVEDETLFFEQRGLSDKKRSISEDRLLEYITKARKLNLN